PPAAAASQSRQPAKPAVPKKNLNPPVPPALSGSNVREVMAALDETTGETRQMVVPSFPTSAPSAARASTSPASAAPGVPGMRASGSATPGPRGPVQVSDQPRTKAPIPQQQRASVPAVESSAASMSDTQVLRFLEQRRENATDRGGDEELNNSGISLLKPD